MAIYRLTQKTDVYKSHESKATVYAYSGHDMIKLWGNLNAVYGGKGNDKIFTIGHKNKLLGHDGKDYIKSDGHKNKLFSGDGKDKIKSDGHKNLIKAGDDKDKIFSKGKLNKIKSEDGHDSLNIKGHKNKIWSGEGNDSAKVIGHQNKIYSQEGHDKVTLYGHYNYINTAQGHDQIWMRGSKNKIDSGDGHDKVTLYGDSNTIRTANGSDTLSIKGSNNDINSGVGNDTILIHGNNNRLDAGDGHDQVTLLGHDHDIYLGQGNDVLKMQSFQRAMLDGGEGEDHLHIAFQGEDIREQMTTYGYQSIDAYVLALKSHLIQPGSLVDFSSLGLNIKATAFETLIVTVDGTTFSPTLPQAHQDDFTARVGFYISGNVFEDNGYGVDSARSDFKVSHINEQSFNGSTFTITLDSGSRVSIYSDGRFDYNFANNFKALKQGELGYDQFTYRIQSEDGLYSQAATVKIAITGRNDRPETKDDIFTLSEHDNLSGHLFHNNGRGADSDPDGDNFFIHYFQAQAITGQTTITLNSGASISINQLGEFVFSTNGAYAHLAQGEQFTESMNYNVRDPHGLSSQNAEIRVTITGENDAPIAVRDDFRVSEDALLQGNLFADNGYGYDSDVDSDFHLYQINGVVIHDGSVIDLGSGMTITAYLDGRFTFNSADAYQYLNGGESDFFNFTYRTRDSDNAVSQIAQGTIVVDGYDEDGLPGLNVSDAQVLEGAHGEANYLEFNVSLTEAVTHDVTFDFATVGESASSWIDTDFLRDSGQMMIAAGEMTTTIRIEVWGDNKFEDNETIGIHLRNIEGAQAQDASAVGHIINDDDNDIYTGDPRFDLTVPIFNSKANSQNVIYLDFDGEDLTPTRWDYGQARAYDNDGNLFGFSATERDEIYQMWRNVAEDFAPFNVNVTTDRAVYDATPNEHKIANIITNSRVMPHQGIAYSNVWGDHDSDEKPSLTFAHYLRRPDVYANTISHELGHMLCLHHDGDDHRTYYSGHGDAYNGGWGTLMGSTVKKLTQWDIGEYAHATNQEDDIAIIGRQLGFQADDHGDDIVNASIINYASNDLATGLINSEEDVDVFRIEVNGLMRLNVSGITGDDYGTNLDIKAWLTDSIGNVLASDDDIGTFTATLSYRSQSAETIYLHVDGIGRDEGYASGYSDYGSQGYYNVTML